MKKYKFNENSAKRVWPCRLPLPRNVKLKVSSLKSPIGGLNTKITYSKQWLGTAYTRLLNGVGYMLKFFQTGMKLLIFSSMEKQKR